MSDIILISEVGLYETVKCAICKNPNKTERGCDGSCQYDKELHAKIVEAVTGLAEQRPHGEWIKFTLEGGFLSSHKCSNCGFNGNQLWHFCPNCGADMRKKVARSDL